MASPSIFFPHSRHLLECVAQQALSPEETIGLSHPAFAHFVVDEPYLFEKLLEELLEELPADVLLDEAVDVEELDDDFSAFVVVSDITLLVVSFLAVVSVLPDEPEEHPDTIIASAIKTQIILFFILETHFTLYYCLQILFDFFSYVIAVKSERYSVFICSRLK